MEKGPIRRLNPPDHVALPLAAPRLLRMLPAANDEPRSAAGRLIAGVRDAAGRLVAMGFASCVLDGGGYMPGTRSLTRTDSTASADGATARNGRSSRSHDASDSNAGSAQVAASMGRLVVIVILGTPFGGGFGDRQPGDAVVVEDPFDL